jgi:O-succinylbenzoic acid--CoA ligase
MATPLDLLLQRQDEDWLIGVDPQELGAIAVQTLAELKHWQTHTAHLQPPVMLLSEPDPCRFLAYFIAACSFPCTVALCNPHWATQEWQQVMELVQPDIVLGQPIAVSKKAVLPSSPTPARRSAHVEAHSRLPTPLLLIPTGGSSGHIRFAMHTWETLTASVAGFRAYFGVTRVNSLCVLPLYHVSGLMQFLRSLLSGGIFAIVPGKTLFSGNCPSLPAVPFFLSLVPTQLHRWLEQESGLRPQELERTSFPSASPRPTSPCSIPLTILLGGAPAWDSLLERARQCNLRVALTYGMTETASQIATLLPEEFLQGRSRGGRVLPHANITIRDEAGNALPANHVGRVVIRAKSLMLGYFPQLLAASEWETEDLGVLDAAGYLQIVGRRDAAIISGGENVFPSEVEAAIWQTGLVQDVCVVGLPDADWGMVVTAVYIPCTTLENSPTPDPLKTAIAPHLCRYKHPKHWIPVPTMPRNAQGKLNRQQVTAIAQQFLHYPNAVQP